MPSTPSASLTEGARLIAVVPSGPAPGHHRRCGPDPPEVVADELAPALRWAAAEITRIATSRARMGRPALYTGRSPGAAGLMGSA